ncbi:hypothetical protein AB6A40_009171 [Gnathostoma spinigerum]|uniref:Uncharacterized protein n=1 Tax=Gnathostoma spinigerum TaxID=75299 RepID=A0ABD6F0A6_9BILA
MNALLSGVPHCPYRTHIPFTTTTTPLPFFVDSLVIDRFNDSFFAKCIPHWGPSEFHNHTIKPMLCYPGWRVQTGCFSMATITFPKNG